MPTRPLQPELSAEVVAHAASQHDDAKIRAAMQFRAAQSVRSGLTNIAATLVFVYVVRNQAPLRNLLLCAALVCSVNLWRYLQAIYIGKRVAAMPAAQLRRWELPELVSAVLGSYAMGSAFWLIAAHGDLYVKLVVTLFSMMYMMGGFAQASAHVSYPFLRASGVVIQGLLFWLGLGSGDGPRFDIVAAYCGLVLLATGSYRSHLKQFRESLSIRSENYALLLQSEANKKTVESALREAQLANESKSRFLAAASHDLRQPLHALTMFLGTLTFHVTTDDARRLLGRIKETVHVLEEQFNSLLDLSRFDAGAVVADIKAFRLDSLVERLVDEFRPIAAAKHLEITAAVCPAIASCDPLMISRVLRNLLDNAVKYTAAGAVNVRVTERPDSFLVEVDDTGPGIPTDQQMRIFDEYVQLTNPGRQRQRGVGLGLAIVKRIDQLLGLKLALRSAPGTGSHFSFVVEASADADVQLRRTAPSATSFRTSASIWILDDDQIALEGLQAQLSAWGASVTAFAHPEELLAQLRAGTPLPHWILTDDMLGASLSGLETAQILSQQFEFGKVCLVTGNTEPVRLAQLRSSGFPVIVKPAKPEELVAVIGN